MSDPYYYEEGTAVPLYWDWESWTTPYYQPQPDMTITIQYTCPRCGWLINIGDMFCRYCGVDLLKEENREKNEGNPYDGIYKKIDEIEREIEWIKEKISSQ